MIEKGYIINPETMNTFYPKTSVDNINGMMDISFTINDNLQIGGFSHTPSQVVEMISSGKHVRAVVNDNDGGSVIYTGSIDLMNGSIVLVNIDLLFSRIVINGTGNEWEIIIFEGTSDPTSNSYSHSFISNIEQDNTGQITALKKYIQILEHRTVYAGSSTDGAGREIIGFGSTPEYVVITGKLENCRGFNISQINNSDKNYITIYLPEDISFSLDITDIVTSVSNLSIVGTHNGFHVIDTEHKIKGTEFCLVKHNNTIIVSSNYIYK